MLSCLTFFSRNLLPFVKKQNNKHSKLHLKHDSQLTCFVVQHINLWPPSQRFLKQDVNDQDYSFDFIKLALIYAGTGCAIFWSAFFEKKINSGVSFLVKSQIVINFGVSF